MLTSKYVLRISSNIQNMCQPFIKMYSSKSDKIKRLMKENKLVFGPLVETRSQKKKRLKLEKKGKIPHEKTNTITNTELLWFMENSPNKFKKITSTAESQNEQSNDKDQSSIKKFSEMESEGSTDPNTKNIFHPESNQTAQEIGLNTTSNLSTKDSNNGVALSNSNVPDNGDTSKKYSSNFERLPDIIIKNLPSFPIMGSKQEFSTQSTEILTISGRDDLETIQFPSVTKILTKTMPLESKLALEAWKERMIEKLGQEGFEMHQKALLEDGKSLHSCIAQNLLGKEYEVPTRIEPVFKSVQCVLRDVHHVRAIETHVAHTKLRYKGVVDCIASYRGENYVIDWKKSDRKKLNLKETYDAPVQLSAYIGAINASNLYPFVIKRGLVVIAYTCGAPAMVYEVSDNTLQQYWIAWLRRLQKYYVETTGSDGNDGKHLHTKIKY